MASRLFLIALFLISASPPRKADYQRCAMIHNGQLRPQHYIENGAAPVSDLV